MRWFRFYDDAVNDPKLIKLSDGTFRAWVNLLCVASKNQGALPAIDDIAIILRVKIARAAATIAELVSAGLLDKTATGFKPHNWDGRQYKSDVSTNRVKRFRNGERNVSTDKVKRFRNVSETAPDTEAETEQISEAKASGAGAPIDHRKRLFDEGLSKLAAISGKGPDACRAFVGKCLKAASDDAIVVLGLIEDAERNRVANPTAWIAAHLKPTGNFDGKVESLSTVARRQADQGISFGERPTAGLRVVESSSNVRLLPQIGSERP